MDFNYELLPISNLWNFLLDVSFSFGVCDAHFPFTRLATSLLHLSLLVNCLYKKGSYLRYPDSNLEKLFGIKISNSPSVQWQMLERITNQKILSYVFPIPNQENCNPSLLSF